MQLAQVIWNGRVTAAIYEGSSVRPIPEHTMQDLITKSEVEQESLASVARKHAAAHSEELEPIIPIHPREAWACGCTYEASASFRDAEHGTREGFYAYVHREPRPEIFFKGTARVCVGPGQPIGMRPDSKFTAPEPELAVLLGTGGKVLGYTLANDVSAWDIERENPLYLPQSKVYNACLALGPVIVTADELTDPYSLDLSCKIMRGTQLVFEGHVNTSKLRRKMEELVEYLFRSNTVPGGSIMCTGTGIIVTEESRIQAGDVVSISCPKIGELSNPAAVVN